MAFNTASYFAGVGSVFGAVILGFAGGATITTTARIDPPNRLERVMSSAPLASPTSGGISVQQTDLAAKQMPPSSVNTNTVAVANPVLPDSRVAEDHPATPAAVLVKEPEQDPDLTKLRAVEMRRIADRKRIEARRSSERKKRKEIEAAVNAVRRMKSDGVIQEVADQSSSFGFFGSDRPPQ